MNIPYYLNPCFLENILGNIIIIDHTDNKRKQRLFVLIHQFIYDVRITGFKTLDYAALVIPALFSDCCDTSTLSVQAFIFNKTTGYVSNQLNGRLISFL